MIARPSVLPAPPIRRRIPHGHLTSSCAQAANVALRCASPWQNSPSPHDLSGTAPGLGSVETLNSARREWQRQNHPGLTRLEAATPWVPSRCGKARGLSPARLALDHVELGRAQACAIDPGIRIACTWKPGRAEPRACPRNSRAATV